MKNELKFTELNNEFRKAIDEYLKRKSMEEDDAMKMVLKEIMINFIADDFANLQKAIDNDNKFDIKRPVKEIYFETLCANYIYYNHDFDSIVESAIRRTDEMHDYIMSLDKREHIRSIVKLLADIDDGGLNERNIALIIITIYMICKQYDIDFEKCIADINVEDIL